MERKKPKPKLNTNQKNQNFDEWYNIYIYELKVLLTKLEWIQ